MPPESPDDKQQALSDETTSDTSPEATDVSDSSQRLSDEPEPEEEKKEEQEEVEEEKVEESDESDEDEEPLSKSQQRRIRQRKAQDRLYAENAALRQRLTAIETHLTRPEPEEEAAPREDDFKDILEYQKAVAIYEAKRTAKQEFEKHSVALNAQRQNQDIARLAADFTKAGREKFADFDEVVFASHVPINRPMMTALLHAENGPEVAYALGNDVAQASRIASLPPELAFLELGKISANLSRPNPKKVTKANGPLKQPRAAANLMDKSPEKMSMAQYRAWREGSKG